MTYYELIRACLLQDAEEHPYPIGNGANCPLPKTETEKDGQAQKEP